MNYLSQSLAKFSKLSLREQIMAMLAMVVLLYFMVNLMLLEPQSKKIKQLQQQETANKTELASINKVIAELASGASQDPVSRQRAELEQLRKQVAEVESFFTQSDAGTAQMDALVREVIASNPNLSLVSLKTLPASVFYEPKPEPEGSGKTTAPRPMPPPKTIYRHGVEVSVKGGYLALLSYMANLEKHPRRLFWSDAKLEVPNYPDAVLKLMIYTLSDQPAMPLR